jgi:undecaprenyl-diphosphatase
MLLSIPSILSAGILMAYNVYKGNILTELSLAYQAIGLSFIFSFLAIFLMMKWLRLATFLPFVIYRIVLGSLLLANAYSL